MLLQITPSRIASFVSTSVRAQMAFALAFFAAAAGVLMAPTAGAQEIRPIVFPVEGENYYSDTYGACRSGCARRHLGVDIIGEKMLPMLAARDGVVTWLRHDDAKGNILTITDDDGWQYHYIHINNDTPGTDDGANAYDQAFGPGIAEGVRVTAGQVVAYLGDSGNAEATVPHLHFEIEKPDGSNINPTPSVAAAEVNGYVAAPSVPAEKLGPYESLGALAGSLADDLYGRPLTASEQAEIATALVEHDLGAALAEVFEDPEVDLGVEGVARLYEAYFLRNPDEVGFQFWLESWRDGVGLWDMSDAFADSEEFVQTYGALTDAEFVSLVYENVMERQPDQEGLDFWIAEIEGPLTRGDMMAYFADSTEYRNKTATATELMAMSWLFEQRIPTDDELASWAGERKAMTTAEAIQARFG